LLTLWGKDDLLQVISNQRPVISSVSTTAILTCSPVTDTLITGYLKEGAVIFVSLAHAVPCVSCLLNSVSWSLSLNFSNSLGS
jgi:hypothetical protein